MRRLNTHTRRHGYSEGFGDVKYYILQTSDVANIWERTHFAINALQEAATVSL
jgi:hypothetical protein